MLNTSQTNSQSPLYAFMGLHYCVLLISLCLVDFRQKNYLSFSVSLISLSCEYSILRMYAFADLNNLYLISCICIYEWH